MESALARRKRLAVVPFLEQPPETLTAVVRRAQARGKQQIAKKKRVIFLKELENKGFNSPEHYERFQKRRQRTSSSTETPPSWNNAPPSCAAAPITLSELKLQDSQNIEIDEVEVLDTMQSEWLEEQQELYVRVRETAIGKYRERERMLAEDFLSLIIRVQREAANMRVEMKQAVQARDNGMKEFRDIHETKLRDFDEWYEDAVKGYARFTDQRISDWECSSNIRQEYRKECLQLKTPLCSMLLDKVADERLGIPHYGLGNLGIKAFAKTCVRSNRFLRVLDLSNNAVGDEGAIALAIALCPSVPTAHASVAGLQLEEEHHVRGSDFVCRLTVLNLSNNHITGKGLLALLGACCGVPLDFNRARVTKASLMKQASLNALIKDKCPLESLDVSHNQVLDTQEVAFGFEIFVASQHCSLKLLNCSYNELGTKVGKSIGVALRLNRKLIEFSARWNDLAASTVQIAQALRDNDCLISLDLGYTSFGNAAAEAMARSLKYATSNIRSLLLAENTIGPKGCRALCRAFEQNKKLQLIDLTGNPVVEEGIVACSRLLKKNTKLEFVGLDLQRSGVLVGMLLEPGSHPPGTPLPDKNLVRALKSIQNDNRVISGGRIAQYEMFKDSFKTTFLFSSRWVDEGVDDGDYGKTKVTLSGEEVEEIYGHDTGGSARPLRHLFAREDHNDLGRAVVHDLRACGDAERIPTFPKQRLMAAMIGDEPSWFEDRLLVHLPAEIAPPAVYKLKGNHAGLAGKARCEVTVVNSIQGSGARFAVTDLFHSRVESLLPAGSRAASRQGWRSKARQKKNITTELIPMAHLVREDDFEDEYETQVTGVDEKQRDENMDMLANSVEESLYLRETSSYKVGQPGRMRKRGLEFTWPTKYLPDVEIGSIVRFTFEALETHLHDSTKSIITHLDGVNTSQVNRFGIATEPMLKESDESDYSSDDDIPVSRSSSRRTSTRGSMRGKSRGR